MMYFLKKANVDEKHDVVIVVSLSEIVNDELQCFIINESYNERRRIITTLEYVI
jgi:hypothetical protein